MQSSGRTDSSGSWRKAGAVVDLHRVDLNLLVALDALITERNVTHAAARLCVSQPAMSATLARLRRLFDDPILVKEGRRLAPTSLADALTEPLQRALREVEKVLAWQDDFDPHTAKRTFSVIATDYVTLIFLQALLTRLADEAPHVTLNVFPVGADAHNQLWCGAVDLLIHPLETFPTPERFQRAGLFRDRYVVVVDEANREIADEIGLAEFQKQPYLATTIGNQPSFAELQLAAARLTMRCEMVTNHTLAPWLVRGTRYTTLVQEHLAEYVASLTGIRLLEPPLQLQPVTEAMMWTSRNTNDPGHRWLRRTVQRVIDDFALTNWDRRPVPHRTVRSDRVRSGPLRSGQRCIDHERL